MTDFADWRAKQLARADVKAAYDAFPPEPILIHPDDWDRIMAEGVDWAPTPYLLEAMALYRSLPDRSQSDTI
jgi:hypothetical protein